MKYALTWFAGALTASLWWMAFVLPHAENAKANSIIVPAIMISIMTIAAAVWAAFEEDDE